MITLFKQWRRRAFKRVLCNAHGNGLITSQQLHVLAAAFDKI